ncbi:amino acid adenylation domain-containing protein [Hymenobacter sp. BT635]|uniref:Amino acid adenylation domain-containing protein n=1 Tax=Hymenobacter nitidus TaxID=2880929 RepID=A0ABS8A8F8_9BACT|nr:non-ribosomal peptide synthetase [Hymenobacter nitidus]MCB2376591.1 amino acid adenylation domain-containing protein [Hymenobacter nitidus]
MNPIQTILDTLAEKKIRLVITEQGNLDVSAPEGELSAPIIALLRENKAALMAYLGQATQIGSAPAQPAYELSSAQSRLWIVSQYGQASVAYIMEGQRAFGALHIGHFERAVHHIVDRHEILRTVFREDEHGDIKQWVLPREQTGFVVQHLDLRRTPDTAAALATVRKELRREFDLANGPLFRAVLCRLPGNAHQFMYSMHHIIGDAWSMDVLTTELAACYAAYQQGQEPNLKALPVQYKDYAHWEQQQLRNGSFARHQAYWRKQFEGELPSLELPGDNPRPAVKTYRGRAINLRFNQELTTGIKALSHRLNGTLYMGLLASLKALLYRYTGQQDIIIGSPIAGRNYEGLSQQIGCYVNTLALRTRFEAQHTFEQLFGLVKQTTLSAYEHQSYPFDRLVDELSLKRDAGRSALFDVMLVLQNTGEKAANARGTEPEAGQVDDLGQRASKFDLLFNFKEAGNILELSIEFNEDIYSKATIAQLANHYKALVAAMCQQPALPVQQVEYLTKGEQAELLQTIGSGPATSPGEKTLVHLFAEQVQLRPDATALLVGEATFTYRQLDEVSNQLSRYLQARHGVGLEDLVSIRLGRGEWMIVSILAILKAGAAYVPIDPSHPQERIEYLLQDSQCKACLDQAEIDRFLVSRGQYAATPLSTALLPTNLAYVIYTSGSTGQPKGCALEHGGVINRLQWMWQTYGFTPEDVVLQKTTFTFDVSVWELLLPLCWGCKLVLCQLDDIYSPSRITALVARHQVTQMHFVPSMLSAFMGDVLETDAQVAALNSLRRVYTSGEALPVESVRKWYSKLAIPISNLYGPTEASIEVTYFDTNPATDKVTIGKPLPNTQMVVLDAQQRLVPVGVVGELYIGGRQLARGYWNRPALSQEKFVAHPYQPGARLYRTGDLGRWLPDGSLDYLGRIDHQVKIRGYRIELGEVESVLSTHPDLEHVAVLAKVRTGAEAELVAYLVGRQPLEPEDLRSYMRRKLPEYMVPTCFVQLESMPLTSSGKLDRKALPEPAAGSSVAAKPYEAPRNEAEARMVELWKVLLNKEQVSIQDNFFDLGGNSIKSIRLVSLLRAQGYALTVIDVLTYQVLEVLAERLTPIEAVEAACGKERFALGAGTGGHTWTPLSWHQQGYFVGSGLLASKGLAGPIVLSKFDKESFESAYTELLSAFPVLRTAFADTGMRVLQRVVPVGEVVPTIIYDEIATAEELDAAQQRLQQQLQLPFALDSPQFIRCGVIHGGGRAMVYLCIHHAITDSYSNDLILKSLFNLCELRGQSLMAAQSYPSYFDYIEWQQRYLASDSAKSQLRYWQHQLRLDTAAESPAQAGGTGVVVEETCYLEEEMLQQAQAFCKANATYLSSLLVTAFSQLLPPRADASAVLINVVSTGRDRVVPGLNLQELVGVVADAFPVKIGVRQPEQPFVQHLGLVTQAILDGRSNQDIPFERIAQEFEKLNALPLRTALSGMVNFQDQSDKPVAGLQLPVRKVVEGPAGKTGFPDPVRLTVVQYQNALKLTVRYCVETPAHGPSSQDAYGSGLLTLLRTVLASTAEAVLA